MDELVQRRQIRCVPGFPMFVKPLLRMVEAADCPIMHCKEGSQVDGAEEVYEYCEGV
jgi:hypothetical protein